MWCATRFNFGSTVPFTLYQRHPQAVDSEFLLSADDSCLVFQHKDIKKTKEHLTRDFSN